MELPRRNHLGEQHGFGRQAQKSSGPDIALLRRLARAALALIGEPVDAGLLSEAKKRKSNDDPLYSNDIRVKPELEDMWAEHPRAGRSRYSRLTRNCMSEFSFLAVGWRLSDQPILSFVAKLVS